MKPALHPEKQRLADYASGKLPEPEVEAIATHLSQCPQCEATIQTLEARSDTLASGLRSAPGQEAYADEADCRRAVAMAASIPDQGTAAAGEASAKQAAEKPAPPKPMPKLGPYQLLAKLGEGGMGAVYKARHEHLGKTVAVKILPKKAMQDPAAVARFRREMMAVGGLHHPNIVGAHDAGEAQGVHFLVMEYVAGSDLSSTIKKHGPVTVRQAISYVLQAARGLAFAHSKGIVHRDIKPANLLVDAEGTLKILDMGLARLDGGGADAEANHGLTQTGQVMGTVDYMAPEQAFDTHRADAKADVYSLGCTLYRILTGQNAYAGDTLVQKILAHREQPIPSLRTLRAEIPEPLNQLYQRMVAKQPGERPTMSEVAAELERCQATPAASGTETASNGAAASPTQFNDTPTTDRSSAKNAATPLPAASNGGRKLPRKLIAAGLGGFALLALWEVWLLVKRPDGTEVKMPLEPGTTITVQSDAPTSSDRAANTGKPGGAPSNAEPVGGQPLVAPRWQTPAFEQWLKATQALPAEQQIAAVSKKLMELNPGFDGKLNAWRNPNSLPKIDNATVTEVEFLTDHVTNLSPVRGFPGLARLRCVGSLWNKGKLSDLSPLAGLPLTNFEFRGNMELSDLSPLRGMKLTGIDADYTSITDWTPLAGMPLKKFSTGNHIADISFLRGMPLELLGICGSFSDLSVLRDMPLRHLGCSRSRVSDLSPLKGMPLSILNCDDTGVSDLSPLVECKSLKTLTVTKTKVTAEQVAALQRVLPDCKITWDDPTKAVPSKRAYLDPAFEPWVIDTQKLPAQQQLAAVSKKLMELNPGFDGTLTGRQGITSTPKIDNGTVLEVGLVCDFVTDLSPLRALAGLRILDCKGSAVGKGKLTDLSPLRGMQLTALYCSYTPLSDLSPLEGMPLTYFYSIYSRVADLSPLAGMPLTHIICGSGPLADLTPLKGMQLKNVSFNGSKVTDLRPLSGMPLQGFSCTLSQLSDLSPLRNCPSLTQVSVGASKVTAAQVAALQKALPKCKIDWDDPAKAAKPKLAYLDPAFQKWVEESQKLPAEQQLEAVSKKLMELNPGFDGKLTGIETRPAPKIENGVVTEIGFSPLEIRDLSPVRALPGLTSLGFAYSGPLKPQLSDLTPLADMPLERLAIDHTLVTDLAPLETCRQLKWLQLSDEKLTPAQIATLQKSLPDCKIVVLSPPKSATP